MKENNFNFQKKIVEIRKKIGLKQSDFAEKLGVSQVAISNYEKGNRLADVNFVYRLIREFHINPQWFFYDIGYMNEESYCEGEINENLLQIEDSANMSEINVEGIINRIKIIKSFKFDNELAEYLEITPSALNNFKRRNSLGAFIEKIIHIAYSKDNSLNFNYLLQPIKSISKEKVTIQDIDNLQNQIDHLRNLLIEGDKR